MNTPATQTHDTTPGAPGFLRRCLVGAALAAATTAVSAALATALTSAGVGLATSHADPGDQTPDIQTPVYAPAPAGPWLPAVDPGCRVQLYFFDGRWHCG